MSTIGTTTTLMKPDHIGNKTDHIKDKIVYYRDNSSFNEGRPYREHKLPTTGTTVVLMKADHISNKGKPRQNKNCLLSRQR